MVAGLDDDDDEKGTAHTLGGPQEMAIVNECGPLSLILTSGIPKVMPFGAPSAQVKAGQALVCRARPRGEVTVSWLGRGRQ
jgi:hypothetical protein